MTVQIDGLLSDHRKLIFALHRVSREFLPLPIDPGPDLYEFPKINLRIKIGRKIPAVTARIHIQYIYRIDFITVTLHSKGAVSVDYARIKSDIIWDRDMILWSLRYT